MSNPDLKILIKEWTRKILSEIFSNELPDELNVYDFDDTLVKTEGTIHLINTDTGERRELHPHEFHEYKLKDNEEFDLSDFENILEPQSLPHLAKMKSDYVRLGPLGVSICTARPTTKDVKKFMAQEGMSDIEIVAVGLYSPIKGREVGEYNASKKKEYLKRKLEERNLRILRFYDDNALNCAAARSLSQEFPEVLLEVEQVK